MPPMPEPIRTPTRSQSTLSEMPSVFERHTCPGHGELREPIHPPCVLAIHVVGGIKVLHFRGDARS